MDTTRTDRENRVERAIKNFEERKRRFFRMDGSKVFGEAGGFLGVRDLKPQCRRRDAGREKWVQ